MVSRHAGELGAAMALADEDDVSPAVSAVLVEDVLPGPDTGGTHGLEFGVLPFADDDLVGEAFVIAPPVAVARNCGCP